MVKIFSNAILLLRRPKENLVVYIVALNVFRNIERVFPIDYLTVLSVSNLSLLKILKAIRTNNRDENLEVLCPNCHSMTEHFMFYGKSHKGSYGQKGTKRLKKLYTPMSQGSAIRSPKSDG